MTKTDFYRHEFKSPISVGYLGSANDGSFIPSSILSRTAESFYCLTESYERSNISAISFWKGSLFTCILDKYTLNYIEFRYVLYLKLVKYR